MADAVREYFESTADAGDFRNRRPSHSFAHQRAWVLRHIAGEGRILEIGCGAGPMLPDLLATGRPVVAIELTPKVLVETAAKHAGVRFAAADAGALPFADGSFGTVLAMGVYEYVPDFAAALAEARRVLRPGGALVLTIPSGHSPYHLVGQTLHRTLRRLGRGRPDPVQRRPGARALRAALTGAGFEVEALSACNVRVVVPPLDRAARRLDAWLTRRLEPVLPASVSERIGTQLLAAARRR